MIAADTRSRRGNASGSRKPGSMRMPLHPTWAEIALRLLLTVVAAAVIGFNREMRGHAAGMRTTILVGLAAAVAMIQANALLSVSGKGADSFGVMDLMRLPLGILTGVGFIGAGTILRRGDLVTGVTTAATMWIVTVIGLCFGGGQLVLGGGATALTVLTLWALVALEVRIRRDRRGLLVVSIDVESFSTMQLQDLIAPLGCKAVLRKQSSGADSCKARLCFEISWRRAELAGPPLELLELLNRHYAVVSFELKSESHV